MTEVIKVNSDIKKKMMEFYAIDFRPKTPPYAIFQAEQAGTIVTLYESGKAVFQGTNAKEDVKMWNSFIGNENKIPEKKKAPSKKVSTTKKEETLNFNDFDVIGSDEVGTGDYFGPIVVTAALVKKEQLNLIKELKIQDSKKMTDTYILQIGQTLIKSFPHSTVIMDNKEYNETHSIKNNMNSIKAHMHNKALVKMSKSNKYEKIVIDQFTSPKSYFNYLTDEKEVLKDMIFVTKGEDKSYAVAVGSIISRYVFLKEYEKLEKIMNRKLPKGAGFSVDNAGLEIVKKYGIEKLSELAKISFKNTDKIKDSL